MFVWCVDVRCLQGFGLNYINDKPTDIKPRCACTSRPTKTLPCLLFGVCVSCSQVVFFLDLWGSPPTAPYAAHKAHAVTSSATAAGVDADKGVGEVAGADMQVEEELVMSAAVGQLARPAGGMGEELVAAVRAVQQCQAGHHKLLLDSLKSQVGACKVLYCMVLASIRRDEEFVASLMSLGNKLLCLICHANTLTAHTWLWAM
jgi:hypothetical protein